MRLRSAVLMLGAALAACGSPSTEEQGGKQDQAIGEAPAALPAPANTPSAEQLILLDSRDCRTVAQAYFDALAIRDFAFAARFWNDPVIDDARLEALYAGYQQPRVQIADVREEGAAGSLYCTVTGALSDLGDPAKALSQGEVVLKRVNDVPGATPDQLRWTVRSSTFIEPMERSGRGEPA